LYWWRSVELDWSNAVEVTVELMMFVDDDRLGPQTV
jgi:hypothetical protein